MTNIVMALCLGVLTLLRINALWNPPARPALLASAFAAAGFTLYVEPVYYAVDSLLGGRNIAGLLLSLLVVTAFLQLHAAVSSAARPSPEAPTVLRRWPIQRYKAAWLICCLAMLAGFSVSDVPVSTQSLLRTYGSQPGLLLFLVAASAFIVFTSIDIIRTVISYLPGMSRMFRVGFFLVSAGCLGAIALLAVRTVVQLLAGAPVKTWFAEFYGFAQPVTVICVVVGLSASRLAVIGRALALNVAVRRHLLRILPLWRAVAPSAKVVLDDRNFGYREIFGLSPFAALQRRVTEIRDCQLVEPDHHSAAWRSHEHALVAAERTMETTRTTTAGSNPGSRTTS